jgi:hypothetical protein
MRLGSVASYALIVAKASDDAKRDLHTMTISASSDVERSEDGVPTAFLIWHEGSNITDHGEHFFTKESAKTLIASAAARKNRFSIDVDHMSLNEKAPPENHKAVGWFDIEVRNGNLWAVNVEWTDAVRSGFTKSVPEWKYFSPAYETKKKTGEIARLLNMAVTNNPATWDVTTLATSSTEKTMEDYDKMSLAECIAAFGEQKDESKKAALSKAIRAKFAAAFPDEGEKKDEPKKEEKKASDGEEKKEEKKAAEPPPPEKKEEKKASADDDEKKAESIAASALTKFEAGKKAAEEKAQRDLILAALPEGDRATYADFSLEQLSRVVKRHHASVLENFAAAGTAVHTLGKGDENTRSGTAETSKQTVIDEGGNAISLATFLDRKMGTMPKETWFTRESADRKFQMNPNATPEDAKRYLASLAAEQKKGATETEALQRVHANQKGIGQ